MNKFERQSDQGRIWKVACKTDGSERGASLTGTPVRAKLLEAMLFPLSVLLGSDVDSDVLWCQQRSDKCITSMLCSKTILHLVMCAAMHQVEYTELCDRTAII